MARLSEESGGKGALVEGAGAAVVPGGGSSSAGFPASSGGGGLPVLPPFPVGPGVAAPGPSGDGLVGGAVEGGVGLVPAESIRAGQGVTQEREAEEERRGKGVRQEVEFQGGLGSGGKGGKGGWEEAGFQGGSDPWGGWHDKGLSGQVPILESPPGFDGKQSGQTGYQGNSRFPPYPKGDLCLEDLFREVRAGNTNVDSKFNQLQLQFASFQREFVSVQKELEQIKANMVTQVQFEILQTKVETLQSKVAKIESGGPGPVNPEFKTLYSQLNRLDPANKSIAVHGFDDVNLQRRVECLRKILVETPGCPLPANFDHVHRGKRDERVPTKVTLIEFCSNTDREFVFKALKSASLKDGTGATIVCKRARTSMQKQRNDSLIKAEGLVKAKIGPSCKAQINWQERHVAEGEEIFFTQDRDFPGGVFFGRCSDMTV